MGTQEVLLKFAHPVSLACVCSESKVHGNIRAKQGQGGGGKGERSPPFPNCFQNRTGKNFKSTEIWGGGGRETSVVHSYVKISPKMSKD